jgi:hypothetical protein
VDGHRARRRRREREAASVSQLPGDSEECART